MLVHKNIQHFMYLNDVNHLKGVDAVTRAPCVCTGSLQCSKGDTMRIVPSVVGYGWRVFSDVDPFVGFSAVGPIGQNTCKIEPIFIKNLGAIFIP